MAEVQSARLSSNPYRVPVMPDDVPSMDVSEQTWSDSATNVPEEEASENSSLNETYQEMPSPTATKADLAGLPELPHHLSKHVLRKLRRLVKKRGKEIEIITVFTKEGEIACSHETPNPSAEQPTYSPNPAEGKYLRLALELGFKQEGCPFEFGNFSWLSGMQEEVDDKLTLLGSPNGEHPGDGPHQFYGVLSPTGRYVFAAVLREGPSGVLGPKFMRKMRDLADKLEVYEQWAGKGGFISKIAAKI
ncbi:hypothetical protein INS49_005113 [Diaporthe citri]|uniref:uncharacterized protein n=1 Tax=Diaporthe citri TaxID=83186 RepID=UPI001C7FF317|nr:uncharacterized protein INS49_005113 [Diaporthe citri]KAG6353856.1 hypothetical protein INS49_005113 [Diaporthe citri]